MNKTNVLDFLSLSIGYFFKQKNINRAITFHEIDTGSKYSYSLKKFKEIINRLIDYGFSFYTISDLNNINVSFEGKSIFITFDDSHISSLKGIEYLIKNNLKATIFLVAKDYERRQFIPNNRIPISQLLMLKKNNIEIGCHSYTHSLLSGINDLRKETVIAKKVIEETIDSGIESFSLPYGHKSSFNKSVFENIKAAGFKTCCTQIPSPINLKKNTFLIPRIGIWNSDNEKIIMRKITGNYDFLKYFL